MLNVALACPLASFKTVPAISPASILTRASGKASTPNVGKIFPVAFIDSIAPKAIPSLLQITTSILEPLGPDNQASILSFAVAVSHIAVSWCNSSVFIP